MTWLKRTAPGDVTPSGALGGAATAGGSAAAVDMVDMTVRVGSLTLLSPVMTASGTAGHGAELAAYFDLSRLGAVVVKSLSAEPWPGNPPPRLLPVAAGMLNSVGLQNGGIDAWLGHELPALAKSGARVVVSVWGRGPQDFGTVGRRLVAGLAAAPAAQRACVVAVEANISCPNVEDRQRMFSHSTEGTSAALSALCGALEPSGLPVWAKLSPNVTDLVPIAQAALAAGAGALTLVNTLMGMAVDPLTGAPRLGGGEAGFPARRCTQSRSGRSTSAARPCLRCRSWAWAV